MKLKLSSLFNKSNKDQAPTCRVVEFNVNRLSAANVNELIAIHSPSFEDESCIVIQMDGVSFIDSSGLGFLVNMRKRMSAPQTVIIEGLIDPVLIQLFSLTRMDQIFHLTTDRAATLQKLK